MPRPHPRPPRRSRARRPSEPDHAGPGDHANTITVPPPPSPTSGLSVEEAGADALVARAPAEGCTPPPRCSSPPARALRAFPRVNGAYRDGRYELYSRVNIGLVIRTRGGAGDRNGARRRRQGGHRARPGDRAAGRTGALRGADPARAGGRDIHRRGSRRVRSPPRRRPGQAVPGGDPHRRRHPCPSGAARRRRRPRAPADAHPVLPITG